eukprot:561904-Pyramimonas_sp.AAC.1
MHLRERPARDPLAVVLWVEVAVEQFAAGQLEQPEHPRPQVCLAGAVQLGHDAGVGRVVDVQAEQEGDVVQPLLQRELVAVKQLQVLVLVDHQHQDHLQHQQKGLTRVALCHLVLVEAALQAPLEVELLGSDLPQVRGGRGTQHGVREGRAALPQHQLQLLALRVLRQ